MNNLLIICTTILSLANSIEVKFDRIKRQTSLATSSAFKFHNQQSEQTSSDLLTNFFQSPLSPPSSKASNIIYGQIQRSIPAQPNIKASNIKARAIHASKLELPNIKVSNIRPRVFQSSNPEVPNIKVSNIKAREIQTEDASDVEIVEEFPGKEKQYNGDPYGPNYYDNGNGYNNGYYPGNNNGYPGYNNGYNPGYGNGYDNGYNPSTPGQDLEAFTARRAGDLELIPGRRILFMDTISQLGNGWNNLTSVFHCDTAGYFFFTFSICGERYKNFRVTLMTNGIGMVSAYGDQSGFQMATNSAVLFLRPGDRVYLELAEGGIYEVRTLTGRAYNTFSAFRIL